MLWLILTFLVMNTLLLFIVLSKLSTISHVTSDEEIFKRVSKLTRNLAESRKPLNNSVESNQQKEHSR